MALPSPEIIPPIVAAVAVVVAPIIMAVVLVPFVTSVIVVVALLVRMRGLPDVCLDLLVSLISICPLLGHAEQILDRLKSLAEQLGSESVMEVKTPDEGGDGRVIVDVGYIDSCL